MTRYLTGALLLCLLPLAVSAQDPVFSGPQVGEKQTPFRVLAFSGAQAGKEITLLSKDHKGPTMLVFVHEITRPGFQLMKPLDLYASKLAKDGLQTHFIWLTGDKSATEAWLNRAKKSLRLKSPIVISLDGQEGPGNYGLNRKVTLTILLANNRKTSANFAIIQPNETDAPKVLTAMAKVMDQKKAPTLASLQKELGIKKRPTKGGRVPPALTGLMRRLIQKTNDEATVKKIIGEIKEWAGKDRRKQTQVRNIGQRILRAGYGTEAAQKALKELISKR